MIYTSLDFYTLSLTSFYTLSVMKNWNFVFQSMQNSCSDVYGWLQDATLKCAPDLLPRDDDIHARKICSDFDYSSFELTLERIRFFLKSFWFTSLWKYSRNMALNGWECLGWFASQSHNLNKWYHQNLFMSGETLPPTTDIPSEK